MRKPYRVALPTLAVLALTGLGTPTATAADRVVLDHGHVDVFGVGYEGGALNLHVHDDESATEYSPEEVKLHAKPESEIAVPADAAYRFLGAAGAKAWVLPQVQNPDLLFAGIAAEEVDPGVFTNDSLKVEVVGVRGPADFSIFTTDAFGKPTVLVDSGDGLPDRVNATAGDHLHVNWGFEATGTYCVKVRVSGTLAATGQKVTSPTATYYFKVGQ